MRKELLTQDSTLQLHKEHGRLAGGEQEGGGRRAALKVPVMEKSCSSDRAAQPSTRVREIKVCAEMNAHFDEQTDRKKMIKPVWSFNITAPPNRKPDFSLWCFFTQITSWLSDCDVFSYWIKMKENCKCHCHTHPFVFCSWIVPLYCNISFSLKELRYGGPQVQIIQCKHILKSQQQLKKSKTMNKKTLHFKDQNTVLV